MQSNSIRSLKRRELLANSAGIALFPWAFLGAVPEARHFKKAYDDAAKARRPLIVVVIPEVLAHRERHGVVMGVFLNEGSNEELAPLAIADLVCARVRDVATAIPSVAPIEEPFLLVVFPTDPASSTPAESNFAVLRLDWKNGEWGIEYDPNEKIDAETWQKRRIRARAERRREIATFLREQMERASAPLATLQRSRLAAYEIEVMERGDPSNTMFTERRVIASSAVLLRRLATAEANEKAELEAWLATTVRAAFVLSAPRGADWASPAVCGGVNLESHRDIGSAGPCGAGMVGGGENRFLYFLTDDSSRR